MSRYPRPPASSSSTQCFFGVRGGLQRAGGRLGPSSARGQPQRLARVHTFVSSRPMSGERGKNIGCTPGHVCGMPRSQESADELGDKRQVERK